MEGKLDLQIIAPSGSIMEDGFFEWKLAASLSEALWVDQNNIEVTLSYIGKTKWVSLALAAICDSRKVSHFGVNCEVLYFASSEVFFEVPTNRVDYGRLAMLWSKAIWVDRKHPEVRLSFVEKTKWFCLVQREKTTSGLLQK